MEPEQNSEEAVVPEATDIIQEPSQDPLDQEIERGRGQAKTFTEAERAAFNLKKNAERARELGVDPAEVLGITSEPKAQDDEIPQWYKDKEAKDASQTAHQLAESIQDPKERELVKQKLDTVITSGSPEERVRVARGYVNAVKNGQIAEILASESAPRGFSSGAGAPPATAPTEPELTAEELLFTRPPISMTKAQVIAARPRN